MRRLIAALALGLTLLPGVPASAYLVEVTTSVAVEDTEDQSQLRAAIRDAIDKVLGDAIAFTPTLVVLTNAAVVGDRLYVRLLVADQEGERTFETLRDSPDFDPTTTEIRL